MKEREDKDNNEDENEDSVGLELEDGEIICPVMRFVSLSILKGFVKLIVVMHDKKNLLRHL